MLFYCILRFPLQSEVCMYVCLYASMYIYLCRYVYIYIYTYIYIYIHTHKHTHTHTNRICTCLLCVNWYQHRELMCFIIIYLFHVCYCSFLYRLLCCPHVLAGHVVLSVLCGTYKHRAAYIKQII